ncbi:MAG: Histone H4 [Chaenotheca gracillima]|nr:MAG: Histone H4 [Chaenotheca gracillima]
MYSWLCGAAEVNVPSQLNPSDGPLQERQHGFLSVARPPSSRAESAQLSPDHEKGDLSVSAESHLAGLRRCMQFMQIHATYFVPSSSHLWLVPPGLFSVLLDWMRELGTGGLTE